MDNLTPARLMGLINECIRKRDVEIGRIEILKSFSFFEIDKSFKEDIIEKMNDATFNDRHVIVEVTSGQKKTRSQNKRNNWGRKNSKPGGDFSFHGKKGKKNKRSKKKKR